MRRRGRLDFCWSGAIVGSFAGALISKMQAEWPELDFWLIAWLVPAIIYFFYLTRKAYKADENDKSRMN